ncbi:MAG: hypothetical protein ACTS41_01805 [Candidatus Hodgkinia cicadicola]
MWFRQKNSNMRNHVLEERGGTLLRRYRLAPEGTSQQCEVEVGSDVIC